MTTGEATLCWCHPIRWGHPSARGRQPGSRSTFNRLWRNRFGFTFDDPTREQQERVIRAFLARVGPELEQVAGVQLLPAFVGTGAWEGAPTTGVHLSLREETPGGALAFAALLGAMTEQDAVLVGKLDDAAEQQAIVVRSFDERFRTEEAVARFLDAVVAGDPELGSFGPLRYRDAGRDVYGVVMYNLDERWDQAAIDHRVDVFNRAAATAGLDAVAEDFEADVAALGPFGKDADYAGSYLQEDEHRRTTRCIGFLHAVWFPHQRDSSALAASSTPSSPREPRRHPRPGSRRLRPRRRL
ncbi:MAG: hypothetical protein U0556_14160 [Dehalococcoidia bacterium]